MRLLILCGLVGALALPPLAVPEQALAQNSQRQAGSLADLLDTPSTRSPPRRPNRKPVKKPAPKPAPKPPVIPPPRPLVESVVVDCGSDGPTALSEGLRYLAPGGVIYLRTRSGPCRETLTVTRSATLIGDGEQRFATDGQAPASLAPRDGNPCIVVRAALAGGAPIVLTLRDMTIDARQAGRNSCIVTTDATLRLERSAIHYGGDGSAINLAGGALDINESDITAETYAPAITVIGGGVDVSRTRIRADAVGLDLTVSPGAGPSRLQQVGILANGAAGRPGDVGVYVRSSRQAPGRIDIHNSVICGFNTGAALTWDARAQIDQTRICRARTGLSSTQGQLTVTQSLIGASERGVYADGGQITLNQNRILGAFTPISTEGQAQSTLTGNGYIASATASCRAMPQASGLACADPGYSAQTLADESEFGRIDRVGWLVDGYERGYLRDGGAPKAITFECQRRRFGRCLD